MESNWPDFSSMTGTPVSAMTPTDGHKKRKRVTRACDECRKKKVKCDGQMPCIHCTVYSYECTYDQPSSRKKVPDTTKVETRLRNAEIVLDAFLPGLDINSPNIDVGYLVDQIKQGVSPQSLTAQLRAGNAKLPRRTGSNVSTPDISRAQHDATAVMSPSSVEDINTAEFKIILPPKMVAIQLIEAVWENACVLFRFYHRPSFIRDLDLLYETDPDDYTDKQYKILPLVYSVMAVGVLFSMDKSSQLGIKDASEGYKYFAAARKLLDITDCRDVYSIQSVVMMVVFLQCSARLSTCYSYIGIALRSALRAGLHRKVNYNFNPIELETRKRLFWTIRKMDIYCNAVLGLPRSIDDEDFDQELPMEIDDENITEDGYFPQREGKLSSSGISNAHTKLMTILGHIMTSIYPVRQPSDNATTTYARVEQLETEVQKWQDEVHEYLKPGADVPMDYFKANRLLSLSFCYTCIMLYRPFVHFTNPKMESPEHARARSLGLKCIDVAQRAVQYATDLVSQNMLSGAYWFSTYTVFFSVASLVYYCHVNAKAEPAKTAELEKVAKRGRDALNQLRSSSVTAGRTYDLLNGLFKQLNRKTSEQGSSPAIYSIGNVANVDDNAPATSGLVQELPGDDDEHNRSQQELLQQGPQAQQQQQPSFDINAQDNDNSYLLNVGTSAPTDSPYAYAPGIMDQVDQQLFGRFLPPYMMQNQNQGDMQSIYPDLPGTVPSQQNYQSGYQQPQPPSQPQPQPQQQQQQQQPPNFVNYQDFFNAQPLGPVQNESRPPPQAAPSRVPQNNGGQSQPIRFQQDQGQVASSSDTSQNSPGVPLSWGDFLNQNMELSGLNSFIMES